MLETILIRAVTPGFTEVFGFPKTIRMWDESSFKHRSTAGVRRSDQPKIVDMLVCNIKGEKYSETKNEMK